MHLQMTEECDDKTDDLESPAFEPIESISEFKFKQEFIEKEDDDMDISDGDDIPLQMNGSTLIQNDEVKSNLSSISGLTSNDSQNDCANGTIEDECKDIKPIINFKNEEQSNVVEDNIHITQQQTCIAPEITLDTAEKLPQTENIISNTSDLLIDNMNQDSVLSQVSSTSRLSIVTNNNTNTRMDEGDSNNMEIVNDNNDRNVHDICPYGISEEAQMQKFNESSSSSNSLVIDTDNMSNGTNQYDNTNKKEELFTSFDIKREDIKFEGTGRKSFDISMNDDIESKLISNRVTDNSGDIYMKYEDDMVKKENDSNKSDELKFDEIESTSSETNLKNEISSKSTSSDTKPTNTLDTDDSKPTEDSNSSNQKLKDKQMDSKSSSTRNGNDFENNKHRSRDRSHHSSSKDRHRDKDKERKSQSCHSSSKEKTKTSVKFHFTH